MKQEFLKFSRLFNKVKNSKELNAEEKLILTEIISVTLDEKLYQFTNAQIANWLGMSSEELVAKRIKSLRTKGIIKSETKNVPPREGKGRFVKQRTITLLNIEQWIDRKGTIQEVEVEEPHYFKELNSKQKEGIVQLISDILRERNEPISQKNIFEVMETIGKEHILSVFKN